MKHSKLLFSSLLLALLFVFTTSAFAQEGTFSVGGGVIYGTGALEDSGDAQNDWGFTVNGYYRINEKFRIGASFGYFFPGEDTFSDGTSTSTVKATLYEVNLLGNYYLVDNNNISLYALAGINITNLDASFETTGLFDFSFSGSDNETGLALGAGTELGLGFGSFFLEAKYNLINEVDQAVFGAGLRFGL